MCGIATISIGRGSRGRIPYPKLQAFVRELLLNLSSRGQDASGISVISDTQCLVFKKPLRPSRFVVRPRFKEILESIDKTTNFILLHSRHASVGGNEDNFNNHPIITEPIIGIHNGTLYNDTQLFKKYKDNFDQVGDVDSEVIFRMWNMYLDQGLDPVTALQKVSSQLDGAFTGAAIDLRHTHRMLMFRYQRELHTLQLKHWDMLVAVSEVGMYDKALGRAGMKIKDTHSVPKEETGFVVDINSGPIAKELNGFSFKMPPESKWAGEQRWNQWSGCY